MPLETVKLTASFRLNGSIPEGLFSTYKEVLDQLLDFACAKGITGFKRLKAEKYHELRARYPRLPSHYIYTACQMACSIYKSFRKLKRKGLARAEKPVFKKQVVMLDDHLFSLNPEGWEASIAVEGGRVKLKLLHGAYHEKFKEMKIGQAWLVKSEDFYLKVVFSKVVEVAMDGKAVAVDVNENNVAFGTLERVENKETRERAIRTAYFLKRRRLQSKPRLNEKQLMAKYKGRERRRVEAIYHRIAKEVVAKAKEIGASTIVMEDLGKIRRKHKKGKSKAINGRLNRWSFRKFQNIVDYKARLAGLNVKYIEADYTSSLCPVCGERLSPNGYRQMKCPGCGLEEDRDVIAVKNLLRRYQMDVGASSVHPEGPSMTTERDEKYERGRDES